MSEGERVIAEFSIVPIGKGISMSREIAKCADLIDRSGLPYKINPMGTVVEGAYDEVMDLIRRCHESVLKEADRVLTSIKIDDRKGERNALERKVKSVEEKLGRALRK